MAVWLLQVMSLFLIHPKLILPVKGGEKVLLHFIQDSPGDYLPLEDISKAVGISATAKAGQRPVVRPFDLRPLLALDSELIRM